MNELTKDSAPMHWPASFRAGCDVLCPGCAERTWEVWPNGLNNVCDAEGNEVVAQYSWEQGSWRCDVCDPILHQNGICPECKGQFYIEDHYTWCSEYKGSEDEDEEDDDYVYEYGEF